MLKPLQQWFCDECGEVIEKPGDGNVTFHLDYITHIDDILTVASG